MKKKTVTKLGSKTKSERKKTFEKLNNDAPMKIHGIICDLPDVIGFRALSKSDFDRTSTILVDEWFRYLTKTKKTAKISNRT